MEERNRGRGRAYLARAIQKARNGWKPSRSSSCLECVYTEVITNQNNGVERLGSPRFQGSNGAGRRARGAAYNWMLGEVARRLECSEVTARRRLKQLEKARYVDLRKAPGRGQPKLVVVAERGLRYLSPRDDGLPAKFTTLWTQPMRVNKTKADPKPAVPVRLAQPQPVKRVKAVSDRTRKNRPPRHIDKSKLL
jgi:hypothetical protein